MLLRISLVRISYVAFGSFLLLLLVMGSAEHVSAQGLKFTSPVTYPAGSPYVITSGDFNGDGKVDLVAGDISHGDLVMLLGNGDGSLKAPITNHVTAAPYYVIAGDFNRDGKLDVATANPYAANISVFLGKGDGSFASPANYPVGRFPTQIRAADFNGDGWLWLYWAATLMSMCWLTVAMERFRVPGVMGCLQCRES